MAPQSWAKVASADQVVVEPEQLRQHDPDELGPVRHLDVGQGLHRQQVRQVVGHPGQVVHPVGVGDELVPGLALADLLHAPVVVADVGVQVDDLFPVQGHDEADEAVGAGVVRPDV